MGTVDGCGYEGQLKYTICDACRPSLSNLSMLKPVFHQNRHICCAYNSLRCLDVEIRRFCIYDDDNDKDDRTDHFTSVHACGVINTVYSGRIMDIVVPC